jgi:hypothetical protein
LFFDVLSDDFPRCNLYVLMFHRAKDVATIVFRVSSLFFMLRHMRLNVFIVIEQVLHDNKKQPVRCCKCFILMLQVFSFDVASFSSGVASSSSTVATAGGTYMLQHLGCH